MKIVATVADFGVAANIGGDTDYRSVIIEIPDENVPAMVRKYLSDKDVRKWQTLSFSLLVEEGDA